MNKGIDMSKTDVATQLWNKEVDEVCASLIENGAPPLVAAKRAAEIVSVRRKSKGASSVNELFAQSFIAGL